MAVLCQRWRKEAGIHTLAVSVEDFGLWPGVTGVAQPYGSVVSRWHKRSQLGELVGPEPDLGTRGLVFGAAHASRVNVGAAAARRRVTRFEPLAAER
jgi:hypothetical protein